MGRGNLPRMNICRAGKGGFAWDDAMAWADILRIMTAAVLWETWLCSSRLKTGSYLEVECRRLVKSEVEKIVVCTADHEVYLIYVAGSCRAGRVREGTIGVVTQRQEQPDTQACCRTGRE